MPTPRPTPPYSDPATLPPPRRARRGWVWLAVAALAVLGLPALLSRGAAHKRPFNQGPLRDLAQHRPECVLFGDSMLSTRVDGERLNRLAPFRCAMLDRSASGTAIWYLMLKNFVAPQARPPRHVVIFFRDRQLTLPKFRTTGNYARAFDEYRHDAEPLVDDLLRTPEGFLGRLLGRLPARWRTLLEDNAGFGYSLTWPERLSLSAYPIQEQRPAFQRRFTEVALHLVSRGAKSRPFRATVNDLFGAGKVRREKSASLSLDNSALELNPEDGTFASAVPRSFLPPMLELAQQRGIELIFLRVRRLNELGPAYRDPPGLAAYMTELRAHLSAHGASLLDETQNPEITADYFLGDDHVIDTKLLEFTDLFWREISPLLKARETR